MLYPGVAEVLYLSEQSASVSVERYHNRDLDGQPMQISYSLVPVTKRFVHIPLVSFLFFDAFCVFSQDVKFGVYSVIIIIDSSLSLSCCMSYNVMTVYLYFSLSKSAIPQQRK